MPVINVDNWHTFFIVLREACNDKRNNYNGRREAFKVTGKLFNGIRKIFKITGKLFRGIRKPFNAIESIFKETSDVFKERGKVLYGRGEGFEATREAFNVIGKVFNRIRKAFIDETRTTLDDEWSEKQYYLYNIQFRQSECTGFLRMVKAGNPVNGFIDSIKQRIKFYPDQKHNNVRIFVF